MSSSSWATPFTPLGAMLCGVVVVQYVERKIGSGTKWVDPVLGFRLAYTERPFMTGAYPYFSTFKVNVAMDHGSSPCLSRCHLITGTQTLFLAH